MKYKRKHSKIPVFIWLLANILYFQIVYIAALWLFFSLILLFKHNSIKDLWISLAEFITADNCYIILIILPIFIGYSISLLRSAITEIIVDYNSCTISYIYHTAKTFFICKKVETIPFEDICYYIDRCRYPKFNKIIFPFAPTETIIFYRKNNSPIQFGNTIGWTDSQFREIIKELEKIAQPCKSKKSY